MNGALKQATGRHVLCRQQNSVNRSQAAEFSPLERNHILGIWTKSAAVRIRHLRRHYLYRCNGLGQQLQRARSNTDLTFYGQLRADIFSLHIAVATRPAARFFLRR